ncbi:hypothetical protein N7465_008620, partial [Penicillium sp. CMV-2018d]
MPPLTPRSSASLRLSCYTENSQPRTDISNAFSDAAKLEVSRLSGAQCWSCLTPDPQFAHVIAQKDGQVPNWIAASLLPFSLKSVINCIQLCPTCHAAFDRSDDPRWVFLPTDLDFFIRYELADQQRRAQADPPSTRIVPTIQDYRDHLASKGLVANDAIGGLYRGYYLQNFLCGGLLSLDQLGVLATPKPWHGHPLGAIRRGIAVLGSSRCLTLDRATINNLAKLRDLYFDDESLIHPSLVQLYRNPPAGGKRKRADEETDDEADHHREKKPKIATDADNNEYSENCQGSERFCHIYAQGTVLDTVLTDLYSSTEWVLGPTSTGNDAIERFAPLLRSTDITALLGCPGVAQVLPINYRVHPDDADLQVVITHRGQEFLGVVVIGNANSMAYCRTYVDDIVVVADSLGQHIVHLRLVFATLQKYNICLDPAKARIGFPSLTLLGKEIDEFGMTTNDDKLKAIRSLSFPQTCKQLETYL